MQIQYLMDGSAELIYKLKPQPKRKKLTPVQQAVEMFKAACAGHGIAIPPCNFVRDAKHEDWDKRNGWCVLTPRVKQTRKARTTEHAVSC